MTLRNAALPELGVKDRATVVCATIAKTGQDHRTMLFGTVPCNTYITQQVRRAKGRNKKYDAVDKYPAVRRAPQRYTFLTRIVSLDVGVTLS